MGIKNMKTNIYQKLHKAACESRGVVKGKKVQGMHFNPLLHDEVQKVAMESLLNNGLYPICTYNNQLTDNFILVTCNMKIHDVEDPKQFIEVSGCSAMGSLDKFGTGNGMSYAKKYAYLNALHLKTGLDNEDGYKASPFKSSSKPTNNIPQASGTEHDNNHVMAINNIEKDIRSAKTIYELRKLRNYKYKDAFNLAMKNHLRVYRQLDDLYGTKETQLNTQGVI
jgi:hypothetical protein